MSEDLELKEMQEMEIHYERACKLHEQYTVQVMMHRLKFQENCPHYEINESVYLDLITNRNKHVFHCKRCKKLIKTE